MTVSSACRACGLPRKRRRLLSLLIALGGGILLAGCVSIGSGDDLPSHQLLRLHDAGLAGAARTQPLVPSLLVQAEPGDALADTTSIAYSRAAHSFAFYQYASWTERPVRQLPRLLLERLHARGVAAAVALAGDPLRSDWLLTLRVDTIHHDVATTPGQARLALTAALFDRRSRQQVASRSFEASVPVAQPASAAAAQAMSQAVAQSFDALVPWLETTLAGARDRAGAAAR